LTTSEVRAVLRVTAGVHIPFSRIVMHRLGVFPFGSARWQGFRGGWPPDTREYPCLGYELVSRQIRLPAKCLMFCNR
jgi:hypothetical protein